MGKAKKIRVSRGSDQEAAAPSLHEQIESDRFARPSGRQKGRARQEEEDVSDGVVCVCGGGGQFCWVEWV